MTDITYPQGCRPLTEDLGTDELIRRLKTLAHTLQSMGQRDPTCRLFVPLALHLVDENFLQHPSRDVQLLTACCVADVLRLYAPDAPYKDHQQIKIIFQTFNKLLQGLKDPKDPSFKRYFYLLENLAYVKSYNMCFEIEEYPEIYFDLFSLVFKIINDEHSGKVKNFIIDILQPIIAETDSITSELLDVILINIVEPYKSQNKHAYQLARDLIIRCNGSMEKIVKLFFNQVLVMDKIDKSLAISAKIYDVIYELNVIDPEILCSILPQLECKLKATNESERHKAVSLLARMFSEKGSQLSKRYPSLLRMFFGRFCDIAVSVRIKCVQSSMHFLLNQSHLRDEIIENLKVRQHDSDEIVRYEVVMAIVETAKRDFKIVCESEDLLEFVKERTLDKKFKIRKEAMNGLAMIYKQAICEPCDISEETKNSVDWIKNKILHGYYMPGIEDRLLVERLLITCLVPYKLTPDERMKKLYHLLGTLDENATKAFIELQKNQMKVRKTVSDWVKLHYTKDNTAKFLRELNAKQIAITKLLPDPLKASEFLGKFSLNMRRDPTVLRYMEVILKRDVSCKECADTMAALLKKLGNPVMTNLYYNIIKMLLERIASVMVDRDSIGILIGMVESCMQEGTDMAKQVGIPSEEAGERGLKLLTVLCYVFSAHFLNKSAMRHMVALMSYDNDYAAPLILKAFTHLGRFKPLCEVDNAILSELVPICREFALSGTIKQAKHAVRCIYVNSQNSSSEQSPVIHPMFPQIVEILKTTLSPNCENYRTKLVCLGHIAYNMPGAFQSQIKNIIARRVVKELLIQGVPENRSYILPTGEWCSESELPLDTQCKLDALKTMARWLLGLKTDERSAQKTFRMLSAFINQRGDLLEQNRLSAAEKSWLRLTAACSMLKICEQKGVGDQYSAEQYYNLSQLMLDPVKEVRELFAKKLHKGLSKGLPNKCLPLDFMGFYVLCGHEKDKKLLESMKHFVEADVNRRREYLKTVAGSYMQPENQPAHILPDYMLVFAIPVLAHDVNFTNHEDRNQLKEVEKCLRFILEPLLNSKETISYGFYKNLIELIKIHEDNTVVTDNNSYNLKMWALCDLVMHIINSKNLPCETREFVVNIHLPAMYYKPIPDFQNTKIYIPLDIYTPMSKVGTFINMNHDRKKNGPVGINKRLPINANNISTSFDSLTTNRTQNRTSSFDGIGNDESDTEQPVPKKSRTIRIEQQ